MTIFSAYDRSTGERATPNNMSSVHVLAPTVFSQISLISLFLQCACRDVPTYGYVSASVYRCVYRPKWVSTDSSCAHSVWVGILAGRYAYRCVLIVVWVQGWGPSADTHTHSPHLLAASIEHTTSTSGPVSGFCLPKPGAVLRWGKGWIGGQVAAGC